MQSCWLLFGILLLVLSVAFKNSDRPEGNNNPCPDPHNRNMLQCPGTTIEGEDGDTVILPCSTKNKTDISYDLVEWFKGPTTEDKPIHKYMWREHAIQTPRDDFKGLTSLSEEGLRSGNCSLNLRVTTSHSGSYYCCVPGRLYCTVTLKVHPKGKDTSQEQDNRNSTDRQNNIIGGAVGGVLGVGALIIIIIISLACCYRERLMNRNEPVAQNPEEEQI